MAAWLEKKFQPKKVFALWTCSLTGRSFMSSMSQSKKNNNKIKKSASLQHLVWNYSMWTVCKSTAGDRDFSPCAFSQWEVPLLMNAKLVLSMPADHTLARRELLCRASSHLLLIGLFSQAGDQPPRCARKSCACHERDGREKSFWWYCNDDSANCRAGGALWVVMFCCFGLAKLFVLAMFGWCCEWHPNWVGYFMVA